MSYVRRSSRVLGRTPYLIGKIDVPNSVKIETNGEHLAVSGDLGTVRTDLRRLDTKGCSAIKVLPEDRQIAIACCDKEFFGTIQTLIKNSINVSIFPLQHWLSECRLAWIMCPQSRNANYSAEHGSLQSSRAVCLT